MNQNEHNQHVLNNHGREPVGRHVREIIESAGPMKNLGGLDANGNLPEEDRDLLDRTKHVRRKGERLMELIARVGISPVQIRAWSREQIQTFCEQGEARRLEEAFPVPPHILDETPRPARASQTVVMVG